MSESSRILFVDDEERVLKALRRHFLDDDYEILTASSAREGLAILEEVPVQVVVSDFRMPVINGAEFLRQVSERWPETTRIVLSGYADIAAVISAINEGAIFKFISKPWKDNELKDTVREAVERFHSTSDMRRLAEQALAANQAIFEEESDRWCEVQQRNVSLEADIVTLEAIHDAFFSSAAGIVVFNQDSTIQTANPTARLLFADPKAVDTDGDALVVPLALVEDVRRVLVDSSIISRHYQAKDTGASPLCAALAPLCRRAGVQGVVAVLIRSEE
jgi:two-component system NtrC family sensor kinase